MHVWCGDNWSFDYERFNSNAVELVRRKVDDLPIEQPTAVRLKVKLKTAKALGLNVPTTLIVAADEVIE
jgi:hypothetical protein